MIKLKVTSTGVTLPQEVLAKLNVKSGAMLYFTESPEGGYRITPEDSEFSRQRAISKEIMRRDHNILAALAK